MNRKKILLTALLGSLTAAALAAPALACPDCWGHRGSSTSADRVEADGLLQKDQKKLTAFEAKLRATSRNLDKALADEDAAKAQALRDDLYRTERDYWALRDAVRTERRKAGVRGPWDDEGWTCRWHDGHARGQERSYAANRWDGRWGCP